MRSYRLLLAFSKKNALGKWMWWLLLFLTYPAVAVVNVEKTRVIFNHGEMVALVGLINSGETPTLVQLWVDDGDIFSSPENAKTPVIALPPVFRLHPGELKDVKLQLISSDNIPSNKESLYWLNIYQIPPKKISPDTDKRVILPLRIRIKVFFRPVNVAPPQQVDGEKLQFRLNTKNHKVMILSNPTPWYMTLSSIKTGNEKSDGMMLAPGEEKNVTLERAVKSGPVQYEIINDSGNKWSYSTTLQ